MKYGEAVKASMEELAKDPGVLFIGYNLAHGSKAYGSLQNIPREKIIETPVAENLMAGLSIGMAMEGFRPVLIFERHDFVLNALDGLVNHLDKMEELSHRQYSLPVIIRAIIGSKTPINPGPQHEQDFTRSFEEMFKMQIFDPRSSPQVLDSYEKIKKVKGPAMVIERRDLYGRD